MKLTHDNLKFNSMIEQFSFSIGDTIIIHITMQTHQVDIETV